MGFDLTVGVFLELTLDDLDARLKGVAEPLLPLTVAAFGVFLMRVEVLEAGAGVVVALLFRLELDEEDILVAGGGVGDLEVALEEAGVEIRDRDELGVSERSRVSKYLGFCTTLLPLEPKGVFAGTDSCSSESISRCVLERRLELARPLMTQFASVHPNHILQLRKHHQPVSTNSSSTTLGLFVPLETEKW